MTPKVSIIVPLYNSQDTISRCIKSIKKQTYYNFECIIINDGSTDESVKAAEIAIKDDTRFRLISQKNKGVSKARNKGIDEATGEWITFVDSDDSIEPNRIYFALNAEQFECDIIKCDIYNHHEDGSETTVWSVPYGEYTIDDKRLLSSDKFDNSACYTNLYKRKLLVDNKIRFPNCNFAEDFIFNSEAYLASEKLFSIEIPLYNYYHDKKSEDLSSTLSAARFINTLNCFEDSLTRFKKYPKWNVFRDVYMKNFLERKSISRLRSKQIDYVVPYVNNKDPKWIEKFNKYSDKKIDNDVNGNIRFDGSDEMLKYHFRSLAKNMPFVGVVHLLVDDYSQVPEWLNRKYVHVVPHSSFIPEEYLPVFNSTAIEMFLKNIPGLTEKFIYSNDDIYYLNEIKPKFYFDEDKIKINLEEHIFDWPGEEAPLYKIIFTNSWNVARYGDYKKYTDHLYPLPPHCELPYRKSNVKNVFNKYEKIIRNSITKFRDKTNICQYIYLFEEYFNRNLKLESHSYKLLNSKSKKEDIKSAFEVRSVCFNDTTDDTSARDYFLSLLKEKFPDKCKYEN